MALGVGRDGPVVGGGYGGYAPLRQAVEDGPRQGRPLLRVGARADLVQQHQRRGCRIAQDVDHVPHVRAEGGYGPLDALPVAHVRVNAIVHGDRASLLGGDLQARLVHGGEEPDRLHRDGLAARVRPGDDQDRPARADRHVYGNGVVSEQGMARGQEPQTLGAGPDRSYPGDPGAVPGPRQYQVEPRYALDASLDVFRHRADQRGEVAQDPVGLSLLLQRQLSPLVAQLDGGERLDEQGRSGVGRVEHDARNAVPHVGLDLERQPLSAEGDDVVLERLPVLGRLDDPVQRLYDPLVCRPQTTPDGGDGLRRRVEHLAAVLPYAAADLTPKLVEVRNVLDDACEDGDAVPAVEQRGPGPQLELDRLGDLDQLLACEHALQ